MNEFKNFLKESKKNKKLIGIFAIVVLVTFSSLICSNNSSGLKMELLVLLIVFAIGIFSINYYTQNTKELYKVAFCIVLCFGLVACLVTPLFSVPDENEHFARSELTSHGDFFPTFNGGFDTIQGTLDLFQDQGKNAFDASSSTNPINKTMVKTDSAFQQNPFYGYFVQGIGIALAKLLNLSTVWMLWLGRICNVILYSALVAVAIRKTPILKIPMIAIACIPIALFQSASVSIDPMINGLGLILIAYIFHMFKCNEKSIDKRDIALFSILVLMVTLCKVSYCVLILPLFILPRNKFKESNYYYLGIISAILVIVISLAWSKYYATPNLWHSYRAIYYQENNVNLNGQIQYILSHPIDFIKLICVFPDYTKFIFDGLAIYSISGQYSSSFISALYIMFMGALIFLYPIDYEIPKKYKYFVLVMLIMVFYGTLIIQLLTWTNVGNLGYVEGLQTRYFIPFFILLPFVFSFNKNKKDPNIDRYVMLLVIIFASSMVLSTVTCGY